jgi:hypothetical protein
MKNQTSPEFRASQIRFAPFALTVLSFALPFVEISCQGKKALALTGIELVTGTEIEQRDQLTGAVKKQKVESEGLFVAAAACTVAAAALCFASGAAGKLLPAVAGVVGIALMLFGKSRFDEKLAKEGQGVMANTWEIGFVLACVLLLIGTLVAGFHMLQSSQQKPSEPAPS